MIEHWGSWAFAVVACFGLAAAAAAVCRRGRVRGVAWHVLAAVTASSALAGIVAAVPAAYLGWVQHRPPPTSASRELAPGVRYERIVRDAPRPIIAHVLNIDLATPGLRFVVTPRTPTDGFQQRGRTTSAFAREHDCDVAINANYFRPFRSTSPWDYYPRAGDGCDVLGIAQSAGDRYGDMPWRPGVVALRDAASTSDPARVEVDPPTIDATPDVHAIAGNGVIVRDGAALPGGTDALAILPYPRAALGLSRDRRRMFWVVIDGKQRNYSEGVTLEEFAQLLLALGVDVAVRLDEGGSATLVGPDETGEVSVLNSTSNGRIIGRERPVANHLGLRLPRGP